MTIYKMRPDDVRRTLNPQEQRRRRGRPSEAAKRYPWVIRGTKALTLALGGRYVYALGTNMVERGPKFAEQRAALAARIEASTLTRDDEAVLADLELPLRGAPMEPDAFVCWLHKISIAY